MTDFHRQPVTGLHQQLGATWMGGSNVRFCVWSPTSETVDVEVVGQDQTWRMSKTPQGYHHAQVDGLRLGDKYYLRFDGGRRLPDPTSRFQPDGVHGPSQIVDHRFQWNHSADHHVDPKNWIIYELHVGTFTAPGTYEAAIGRLDELVDLGITAIELMPIADAAGRWNWGYDGVCLFAPNRNYGTPQQLKQFIDHAHGKGLAVFLDVVYNHLGPEGNYLGQSGPYLSTQHHTAWGPGPNFDHPQFGPQLKRWFIANAIYWLDEYHFDGLRVDAIHCMADENEPHVMREMSEAIHCWSRENNRHVSLIAESNVYDPEITRSFDDDGYGFDAQWGDCFLHSMFATVRPGEQLCHRTYHSPNDLDQVLRVGYVYTGTMRKSCRRSDVKDRVQTQLLIYSIQNHDFIGNHPLGKRLHQLTSYETQRAAAALLILSPAVPMLFMGEEFASPNDFAFFVDFSEPFLQQSVIEGRRREYPQHDWSGGYLPTEPETFYRSKIGSIDQGDPAMRLWYRQLIAMRKQWRQSGLLDEKQLQVTSDPERGIFVLTYLAAAQMVQIVIRLSPKGTAGPSVPLIELGPLDVRRDGRVLLDSLNPHSEFTDLHLHPNHAVVISHG